MGEPANARSFEKETLNGDRLEMEVKGVKPRSRPKTS